MIIRPVPSTCPFSSLTLSLAFSSLTPSKRQFVLFLGHNFSISTCRPVLGLTRTSMCLIFDKFSYASFVENNPPCAGDQLQISSLFCTMMNLFKASIIIHNDSSLPLRSLLNLRSNSHPFGPQCPISHTLASLCSLTLKSLLNLFLRAPSLTH